MDTSKPINNMKENAQNHTETQWTPEQLRQSIMAMKADRLTTDQWARLAVRNPERYHEYREAQRLVREGKAPHDESLWPSPYPDGAIDRFMSAIDAGKSIDEARVIAGISVETLRWILEQDDPFFDLFLAHSLERGSQEDLTRRLIKHSLEHDQLPEETRLLFREVYQKLEERRQRRSKQ